MDDIDYSFFENFKTFEQEQDEVIEADMLLINDAIERGDVEQLKAIHIMIDGKYSAYIPDFGKSMYGYAEQFGFDYNSLGEEALKHNLSIMQARMQGYLCGFPAIVAEAQSKVNVNVPITNEFNINITFEQARQKIEDMPGLNDEDTEEIKSKIDELENISKEPISKKKKWEKVKPILSFAIDKSADVAISIMSLILQMKLGM